MMKFFVFFFFIFTSKAYSLELKVGDVLLQPLQCRLCTLIEDEEETIFSHMGIVIQTRPEVLVAESWGVVRSVSLEVFDSKTQVGQALLVIRLKNKSLVKKIKIENDQFLALFEDSYAGKKYDSNFLWENFDENGDELLYCSEFVGKFLKAFLGIEFPVKRMHFSRNTAAWERHFKGSVPYGKWGNSPGDFERSPLFEHVQ